MRTLAAALLISLAGPCLAQTGQYAPDLTRDASIARGTVGVAQGLASPADRYRAATETAEQRNVSPYANLGIGQVKPGLQDTPAPCGGRSLGWEPGRQEPCAPTGWFSGPGDDTGAQTPATGR